MAEVIDLTGKARRRGLKLENFKFENIDFAR
jgi:hypothetical protein